MTDASRQVDVVVTVPPGSRRPEPVLDAVLAHHPGWNARAIWAGDPQLRPRLAGGHRWVRPDVDEIDLLRVDVDALPWLVALTALLEARLDRPTIVLVTGVAVLGPLDALVPDDGRMTVVPRMFDPIRHDGLHPTIEEWGEHGAASSNVAAFGAGTNAAVEWLRDAALVSNRDEVAVRPGRLIELAAQLHPSQRCLDERIGASAWRWPDDTPHLVDLPRFDVERPWIADPDLDGPPRISLATPERIAVVERAAEQLAGRDEPLRLPGGIDVDAAIRRIARRPEADHRRPWGDATAFRRWLEERYWAELHADRPDLQATFPYPEGVDAGRFAHWKRRAIADGLTPVMIDPGPRSPRSTVRRTGDRRDGVNLVGYFRHQSGVADVGRRVAGILDRQGVPHSVVAFDRTTNPPIVPEPEVDQELAFADTLAFVNGDQFGLLYHDLPQVFGDGRQVVGMWSWELESIEGGLPLHHRYASQIWGTTRFMADPFRVLDVPVHHVHVPFTEPVSSGRPRDSFPVLADVGDRFVFGAVLDHLSVTERKNPVGAVRAFREAFAPGEGPLLVVKTINAHLRWSEHERLLAASAGRDDVVVWDELLPRADQVALIGSFDALVSLHRSEGVGLHMVEAMWLERPIIATNYSGNLDFMDDDSAILIDADRVPVGPDSYPYPPSGTWAAPRTADAAAAMRRLASDPAAAAELGRAARAKISAMPGEDEFVRRLTDLLHLER